MISFSSSTFSASNLPNQMGHLKALFRRAPKCEDEPGTFKELFEHEKEFSDHFVKNIAPRLDEIEKKRVKSLTNITLAILAGGGVWLLAMLAASVVTPESIADKIRGVFVLAAPILGFAGAGLFYMIFMTYAKSVLAPLVVSFFPEMSISPASGVSEHFVRESRVAPRYDRYHGEDLITGLKKGKFVFESSEINLKKEHIRHTKEGTRREYQTVFQGLMLRFALPRSVSAPVLIKPENKWNVLFSWASNDLPRVKLEDPVFERLFAVSSTDQIESRRVLQPALMVRLIQFSMLMENWGLDPRQLPEGSRPGDLPNPNAVADAKFKFSASFIGDNMYLLVPCDRNLFETGSILSSAFNTNEIRSMLYQIHLIRRIVEELEKFPQLG